MFNLFKEAKFVRAITPTEGVAGATDINGAVCDMSGYDSVAMLVCFGAITAGAVTSIKAQQGALSNGTDMADLEDTAQTVADDDDEQMFIIDLHRPKEEYVRVTVDRGTQNAVVTEAWYILYNGRQHPVTQPTGVNGELHVSPAEGTA
ncbi:MAG: hypothetical protein HZB51_34195 [Chloroflexi bacterium]|nr:hypothetical protein [Chloroflexota bacterium]